MPSQIAEYECVLSRPSITGESPVWCELTQRLYWVDVQEPALHCFDPATRRDESWIMPAWIGSFALGGGAAAGTAVVALRTGVCRFDFATGALTEIAPAPYDMRRFFLNDGKCDRRGRFWVGPMHHVLPPVVGPAGPNSAPLWRLDGNTLVPRGDSMSLSNGLAWSPDGGTMYHSGTQAGVIHAFDYDEESGEMSRPRVFARFEGEGGPDGAAIDRDGYYWTAMNGQGRLLRLDPAGQVERELRLPIRYPTMCAFGGPALDVLYIASGRWPIPDLKAADYPLDGSILAVRPPVPGLPTNRWQG